MQLTAQFCLTGFATALFCFLMVQLPAVRALRWWGASWAAAFCAITIELMFLPASSRSAEILIMLATLLLASVQIGATALGVLTVEGRKSLRATGLLVVGYTILLGYSVFIVVSGPNPYGPAAVRSLALAVVCSLIVLVTWNKARGNVRAAPLLYGLLAAGLLGGVLDCGTPIGVLPERIVQALDFSWAALVATCGAVLAMSFLAISDIANLNAQLRRERDRLRIQLQCADIGICEVDGTGRLQSANQAAFRLLSITEENIRSLWLPEQLEPCDETSRQALSEFALLPTASVNRAKVYVRVPGEDREVPAEWSSQSFMEDGKTTGAVITLRDTCEREQADRFLQFRCELLEKIAQNKPVEETLRLLATAVEGRLPGFACGILICGGETFQVIGSSRWPTEFRDAITQVPPDRFPNSGNRAVTIERRPWDTPLRQLALNSSLEGTWTEPMISSANELLGTVVLTLPQTATLDPGQTRILKEAARLSTLTIEHRRFFERLMHQGHHDVLTGLPNRLLFADRLKQAIARAERSRTQVAYLCIDLDRFKYVNDTLGHDVGDGFLQQISVRLAARIRSSDTLARTGGDEFTAVLSDVKDQLDAVRVAESLIAALREPFDVSGHTVFGSASIGIAMFPKDGRDSESLQRNADRAMYRAKAQGRNGIQLYSPSDRLDEVESSEIEFHLHRAIEQGNFQLHFQPQFTCDRHLSGFEALLRFYHPKLGAVPPSRFIPMAEDSGLILPIGEWVLQEACRQIAEWQSKGMRPIRVAVNVSPLQFAQANFAQSVLRALHTYNVNPELLELELTESVLMSSIHDSARQMAAVAATGVRLAVDDFGTGYSSLSYLHQLPIHILKIDRSFIAQMLEPDGTRCIVEAIISLAQRLGLHTVAEGVENQEQLDALETGGCDLIQGYFFSRPLAPADASSLLWKETMAHGNHLPAGEPVARPKIVRSKVRR